MKLELQPTLVGELVRLLPLKAEDWSGLFAVASDPLLWEQHPLWNRYQEDVFRKFFDEALLSRGALTIWDNKSGSIIGSSRYYTDEADPGCLFVGFTFIARNCWGGEYNKEIKALMLNHAFKTVDTVYFHVGETNLRSQKALLKLGAQYVKTIPRSGHGPNGETLNSQVYQISKI